MAAQFDQETIERLRGMSPCRAFEQAKDALFGSGSAGSEDFMDIYRQLVDEGLG